MLTHSHGYFCVILRRYNNLIHFFFSKNLTDKAHKGINNDFLSLIQFIYHHVDIDQKV